MSKLFRALLYLSVSTFYEASAYDIWHPIDVQSVICPSPATGEATTFINISDIGFAAYSTPHILTFYRSFSQSVTIYYKATDANGKAFIVGTGSTQHAATGATITGLMVSQLTAVPATPKCSGASAAACAGRRLSEPSQAAEADAREKGLKDDLLEAEDPLEAEAFTHEDPLDAEEWVVHAPQTMDDKEAASERAENKLLGRALRRSRFSSSRPSPRPRPRPSPVARPRPVPIKPTPSTGTSPASYTAARRRLNPETARRRGTPTPTGARRRINSPVGTPAAANPSNPAAGNYGYASQSKINNNYPSGYSSTGYGYTGANAHKASSNKNLMMKAAVGAAVVGGGGLLLYGAYSRWGSSGWGWGDNCYHDVLEHGCYYHSREDQQQCTGSDRDSYSGSCRRCYNRFGTCGNSYQRNAARDDMMRTGFVPQDFASPIQVTIYKIEGNDFTTGGVCPPDGWSPNASESNTTWTTGPADPYPDIFLTLTSMLELEENLAWDDNGVASAGLREANVHAPLLALTMFLAIGLRRIC